MKTLLAIAGLSVCLCFCLLAAAQSHSRPPQHRAAATSSQATAKVNRGEEVFRANCGRCHNAPQELSPRVVRAVVRQMRVRAMLTGKDEQALLKFLAP